MAGLWMLTASAVNFPPNCKEQNEKKENVMYVFLTVQFRGLFIGDRVVTIYSNLFPSGHYLI